MRFNEHLFGMKHGIASQYYPLVICYIAIEHGNLYRNVPLKMVIFHSFLYVYQRVIHMNPMFKPSIHLHPAHPNFFGAVVVD